MRSCSGQNSIVSKLIKHKGESKVISFVSVRWLCSIQNLFKRPRIQSGSNNVAEGPALSTEGYFTGFTVYENPSSLVRGKCYQTVRNKDLKSNCPCHQGDDYYFNICLQENNPTPFFLDIFIFNTSKRMNYKLFWFP